MNSKWIKGYSICTLVCILVDALCFCVAYRWFIEGTSDHTNVWMLFAFTGMLVYDTLQIWYMLTLKRTLPTHVSKWLWEAFFGDVNNLKSALKTFFVDDEAELFDQEVEKQIEENELLVQKRKAAA